MSCIMYAVMNGIFVDFLRIVFMIVVYVFLVYMALSRLDSIIFLLFVRCLSSRVNVLYI